MKTRERIDASQLDLRDTVVAINRVTKVVKGGKNLSFSALVVVGDGHGVVGFGVGKAKEVPSAIKKGIEAAKKGLIRVPLQGTTVPHTVTGRFGAGSVLMGQPAVRVLSDRWTAVTKDGQLSAHFEHTVAVTKAGALVLTALGGPVVAGVDGYWASPQAVRS